MSSTHRGHQSKIVIGIAVIRNGHQTKFVITYGVIATPLRHHNLLRKEKVPDRCRGLSPKP
jgi:hypothetical protein